MKFVFAGALLAFCFSASFAVGAEQQCNTVADDGARLQCWDRAFPPTASAPSAPLSSEEIAGSDLEATSVPENGGYGPWQISTEKDALTDETNIMASTRSTTRVPGRFSDNDFAVLMLSCRDNATSIVIQFGGAYMVSSEYNRFGEVAYRVDKRAPGRHTLDESTSNQHLGYWRGAQAIPFIKEMLGGKSLLIEATPYNENPVQLHFDISWIDDVVAPIRSRCGW